MPAQPTLRLASASEAQAVAAELGAAAALVARRAETSAGAARSVAALQVVAAQQAVSTTASIVTEQGMSAATQAAVATAGFAGLVGSPGSMEEAFDATGDTARLAHTLVVDAFRQATVTAAVTTPTITGYTRMLNPPSCSRCVVLAGKKFNNLRGAQFHEIEGEWVRESNAPGSFQRHPLCDCTMIPTTESIASDLTVSPEAYFDSLTEEEQAETFGKANAEAIRLGSDIGQVVNAYQGRRVTSADGMKWTTAGMSRRGNARRLQQARRRNGAVSGRLMPESILRIATDRNDAIRLLRLYGYIT